jgi:hypothetical protein
LRELGFRSRRVVTVWGFGQVRQDKAERGIAAKERKDHKKSRNSREKAQKAQKKIAKKI